MRDSMQNKSKRRLEMMMALAKGVERSDDKSCGNGL